MYTDAPMSMHYCQQGAVKRSVFVVRCKRCQRDVPSGCEAFPACNIVVQCPPLCGERRRYRPAEVYLGIPHQLCNRNKDKGL